MKTNIIKIGVCILAAISLIACKKENQLAFSPNPDAVSVKVGDSYTIKVNSYGVKDTTAYPVSGVDWTVENSFVAAIDDNGVVTGRKVGETKACGKFDNGKVVYADVYVYSENNQYLEPILQSTYSGVASDELRTLTRGNEDENYAVYKGVSSIYSDVFTIYFFNQFNGGVITTFAAESDVEDAKNKFLPDRYMVNEGVFTDDKNNSAVAQSGTYGDVVLYNFGTTDIDAVYEQYAADAKVYIDSVANKENYTQEKLELTLPFVIDADQVKVQGLVQDAKSAIDAGKDFYDAESAIYKSSQEISALYMDSARTWALQEWCWKLHKTPMVGGLRKGHDQTQYSEVSWDRVLELDEIVVAAFGEAADFKTLDQLAQTYGTLYMDVATLANITTNQKTIDTQFKTISAKNKTKYNDYCWAAMEALNKSAKKYLTTIYSYTAMGNFVKTCKSDVFGTSTSYYYDIPTIEDTENYQDELETAFDEYEAKKDSYSAANWKRMQNKHDEAILEILGSRSKTYARATLDEAKQYFYNMPVKE